MIIKTYTVFYLLSLGLPRLKKVNDNGTGNYVCEKCGKKLPLIQIQNDNESRLLLQSIIIYLYIIIFYWLNCVDYLGNCWLDVSHKEAPAIVGINRQKLGELREQVKRRGKGRD